jgi:type IV fimbrial biogenesis protein FimT
MNWSTHHQNRHHNRRSAGRTLIELLSILAIITLLSSQAYSSISGWLARQAATAQVNWLVGAIHYSRHAAITHRTTITLCPGNTYDSGCEGDWEDGLIAFSDRNKDAMINGDDRIINYIRALPATGTFTWRSFQRRPYLQMTELGHTNYQNGNFVYCPTHQPLAAPRQIIVNVQGRVRLNRRRNKAGIVVDSRGRPLRC